MFNDRVMNVTSGESKERISPEAYGGLSEKEQAHCKGSLYSKYKTKKIRDYDECYECGHRTFSGWIDQTIGIGEPLEYKKMNLFEIKLVDSILKSNILYARILKDKK